MEQFGLPWLAHRSQLRIQPQRDLVGRAIFADWLTVGDPRKQKPHLFKRKSELAPALWILFAQRRLGPYRCTLELDP